MHNDLSFKEDILVESPHHFRVNEFLKEFNKKESNQQLVAQKSMKECSNIVTSGEVFCLIYRTGQLI